MIVWTFNTSSDFENKLFLNIGIDNINCFDDVGESLSGMKLHSGAGCPDTTTKESLNAFWKNMLEDKTQEIDNIDSCESIVRANEVSANRTEQNRTEQNRTEQNKFVVTP